MDITAAITGLVMLGIFIVPIAILSLRNKNKALLAELKDFATQNNCEISEYDINAQFAIGMSTPGNQVFFIRKEEANQDLFKSSIPLNHLIDCGLKTQNRTVNLQKSTEKVIDKLEISFQSKSQEKNTLSWVLYDSEMTTQLDNEFQVGNKWVSIIKKAI
ncbi:MULTISPECIES: hypothetical protein [unclassified Saccharicrinis]|uniref:hypothetical protein n=1 Tax=unclassified Saccharicrinis TaxID=2646859 RepID=UPI003D32E375